MSFSVTQVYTCLYWTSTMLEEQLLRQALYAQRFGFQCASSTPATRHPSVIPVGPADGMEMLIS